jgi:hypothetical protein
MGSLTILGSSYQIIKEFQQIHAEYGIYLKFVSNSHIMHIINNDELLKILGNELFVENYYRDMHFKATSIYTKQEKEKLCFKNFTLIDEHYDENLDEYHEENLDGNLDEKKPICSKPR